MKNKGIIFSWHLKKIEFLKKAKPKNICLPPGRVFYYQVKNFFFIPRHGLRENIPPHQINHQANLLAFKKLGVKFIFSFNSVGSLKKEIKPGYFLIPSDYIDFYPPTFFERNPKFITPTLSEEIREIFIKILKKLKLKFFRQGIYFNSRGPRLETKAEINLIRNFADVVGMTMAKEATLANELNLEYASLCSVDNYAHGIIKKILLEKEIKENQSKTIKKIERIIQEILKEQK
ncbi:MAG: MTAP family purine nucleoside phosphorylase [Patescibacteria group bacterium]|nr:MTAP family purine nucleoside phosphorylase [Patescibacteria group bacterium]